LDSKITPQDQRTSRYAIQRANMSGRFLVLVMVVILTIAQWLRCLHRLLG